MAQPSPVAQLERSAVGLMDVLFQSITSMAPGAVRSPRPSPWCGLRRRRAAALGQHRLRGDALFTAVSIGQLAKHIPAAGSVAT